MAADDSDMQPAEAQPDDFIRLDQFLKLADIVGSGGQAKYLVQSGRVAVNGSAETRRGRKLRHGDVVTVDGEEYVIESHPEDD